MDRQAYLNKMTVQREQKKEILRLLPEYIRKHTELRLDKSWNPFYLTQAFEEECSTVGRIYANYVAEAVRLAYPDEVKGGRKALIKIVYSGERIIGLNEIC